MSAYLSSVSEHREVLSQMELLAPQVDAATRLVTDCLAKGGTVLLCGNGGSATDAEHLAGELVGRFLKDRKALPAIALGSGIAGLTAVANDYGYDQVFARQVEAFGCQRSVLLALSTSGNSPSIVNAAKVAASTGMKVVSFTGNNGGDLSALADVAIKVPSTVTARIQEMHILIGHAICAQVEIDLFSEDAA